MEKLTHLAITMIVCLATVFYTFDAFASKVDSPGYISLFKAGVENNGLTEFDGYISCSKKTQVDVGTKKGFKPSTSFGKLPLYFIPGFSHEVTGNLYYAKTRGYTLWLTGDGLHFDFARKTPAVITSSSRGDQVRDRGVFPRGYDETPAKVMHEVISCKFLGAVTDPDIVPINVSGHRVNYFIGNDPTKWRTNVPTSLAVIYKELYPEIDLKVYGIERRIEYDFVVKPGGDVNDIRFKYDVNESMIDEDGNIVLETIVGKIKHKKPVCYQLIDGKRVPVEGRFQELGKNIFGFKVAGYDKSCNLIIDPIVFIYSTYLGGSQDDYSFGISVDSAGNVYIAGKTASSDFPLALPFRPIYYGNTDAFVSKFNSTGTGLIYSTYLGGTDTDKAFNITIDSLGSAYIVGATYSTNFPMFNAFQNTFGGVVDGFITKLNSTGSGLIYSTYFGGTSADRTWGIAIDNIRNVYITGSTGSVDFPTKNAYQKIKNNRFFFDVFISKLNNVGTSLVYSTYFGGSLLDEGSSITLDDFNNCYVTGYTESDDFPTLSAFQPSTFYGLDAYILKLDSTGTNLVFSTYLGGWDEESALDISVDNSSNIYIVGSTGSSDFPTKNASQPSRGGSLYDVFITKFDNTGKSLIYSTYLGGSKYDKGFGIMVNDVGNAYITGETYSLDFPTLDSYQPAIAGGKDVFIAKYNPAGIKLYSTYLGGSGDEDGWKLDMDNYSNIYLVGISSSTNFPTINAYQRVNKGLVDGIILKFEEIMISPSPTPTSTLTPTFTPSLTFTPTLTSTKTPTFIPTLTRTPTNTPTATYTSIPTSSPTMTPTMTPTTTYTPKPTSTPFTIPITGRNSKLLIMMVFLCLFLVIMVGRVAGS